MRPVRCIFLALVLACALALAGCGSDDDATKGAVGAGSLMHVDGTITMGDDSFTLTPKSGDEPIDFTFGSAVERASVRAFAVSGAPARVSYRLTEQDPVAAAVSAAPEIGEGLDSYVGSIASVETGSIVVDGEDGERSFTVAAQDQPAFDLPHLEDHEAAGTPIRVYFDPKEPAAAVAYEDA